MTYDHKVHLKARRDGWKAAGLCSTCGKAKERPEVGQCNYCISKSRNQRLMREYGITRGEYDEMINRQGFKCAICHDAVEYQGRNTHVDHCHTTGKARAILCLSCNIQLGQYEKMLALDLVAKFDTYLNKKG